jgi:oxygen-independent coproporphyrinogen-3 oxidase
MKKSAIYIHIPFCKVKCIYCDFYSITNREKQIPLFTELLIKEIKSYRRYNKKKWEFNTIFFGGGTPSILPAKNIEKILIQLDNVFDISNVEEITLEANPGEASFNFFNDIKKIGINRLSIGFQSFNDKVLKNLGRFHRSNDCFKTFKNARKAGFENINTDMIFNIPNLSTNQWVNDIKRLLTLEPEHISAYSLTVEPSTKLFNLVKNNKMLMPSEQIDIEQFLITKDILMKNKYFQYEISNYSKKNMECKHNLNYWESNPYISFGPSAHSYDTKKRWWNVKSLDKYLSLVDNGTLPVENFEILKKQDKYNEMILNGLRLTKGISLNKIKKFHKNHLTYLKEITKKWDCIDLSNGYLKLNKNGMLLVDNISSDMFI